MSPSHIIIFGAGPCGLSTAIALSKTSTADHPVRITLVEVREKLQTIGGTLNMTPLAMRYLDHLGVGDNLRRDGIDLNDGLDCVSLRTGSRIGNIWGSIGAIRTIRHKVVENLLRKINEEHADTINVKWGQKIGEIVESKDEITLHFDNGTTLSGDIVLGCDGLHSLVRRLWVDPQRKETFTGRVLVMGFEESGKTPAMRLSNGEAALRDTAVIASQKGMLLASKYEPTRQKTYFAHTMYLKEPEGDARDGWKILGEDQDAVRREVVDCFNSGRVTGVQETVSKCQNWHLYPVYMLPSEGRWYRGRALLLGDAAHAMPPQGESTGLAIEDGVLFARVFERRESRTIDQLFSDFEILRRPVIDKYHKDAVWAMEHGFRETTWLRSIFIEWGIWLYLLVKRWRQEDHFAQDVRNISLPA